MATVCSKPSTYFMDDPREAARLHAKVEGAGWVDRYLGPDVALANSVLEVGCGAASIAQGIAAARPHGRVVGIDISSDRLAFARAHVARAPNLTLCQATASRLPFPAGSFDVVFSRFLLEYLHRPDEAAEEMVRVCRAGGRVILQDLDGQLVWHYPPDPSLDDRLRIVLTLLFETGFDPFIGRKLFHIARAAGLANIAVGVDPYHLIAGPADDTVYALWDLKLDIAQPAIADALGGAREAARLKSDLLGYLRRPDTLTYSVLFTVGGTKPVPEN